MLSKLPNEQFDLVISRALRYRQRHFAKRPYRSITRDHAWITAKRGQTRRNKQTNKQNDTFFSVQFLRFSFLSFYLCYLRLFLNWANLKKNMNVTLRRRSKSARSVFVCTWTVLVSCFTSSVCIFCCVSCFLLRLLYLNIPLFCDSPLQ